MKTICIFGSYNTNSVGDKAILLGLISGLIDCLPGNIQIRVLSEDINDLTSMFSNYPWKDRVYATPLFSKNFLGKVVRKITSTIFPYLKLQNYSFRMRFLVTNTKKLTSDSIGLIVGGGNLIMDLYPNWPILMREIIRIFKNENIPIVFAGVGALPIKTLGGKLVLKESLNLANRIFVRDRVSAKVIRSEMQIDNSVHPDFIFSLPVVFGEEASERNYVALNVSPVFGPNWPEKDPDKYKRYLETIIDAIRSIPVSSKILLFDTNYPTDRTASLQVVSRLLELGFQKSNILYYDRLMSVKEIIELLSTASFTIATRLHAGLMALMANSPVTLLAYQPKVRSVFEMIGLSKSVVELFDTAGLSNNIRLMTSHPNSYRLTIDDLKKLAKVNKETITEVVELFGVSIGTTSESIH